jgi:2-oxoglutarate/2-oxoacid ferredoxin oxidoreductase subunit alpha
VDLMALAFEKADEYRNPVVMIGDGLIGQMMEPVTFPDSPARSQDKPWATTGKPASRKSNIIRSLRLDPEELEVHVHRLFAKFQRMEETEQRGEGLQLEDRPALVLLAYGTTARICKSAVRELRRQGLAVGLFRPITAWPFPAKALRALVEPTRHFLCVEMSMGQMAEDARGVIGGARPVSTLFRVGGMVPTVDEIVAKAREALAAS